MPATADGASGEQKNSWPSASVASGRGREPNLHININIGSAECLVRANSRHRSQATRTDLDGLEKCYLPLTGALTLTCQAAPSRRLGHHDSRDAAPSARNHRACEPPNCKVGFLLVPDRREAHDRSQCARANVAGKSANRQARSRCEIGKGARRRADLQDPSGRGPRARAKAKTQKRTGRRARCVRHPIWEVRGRGHGGVRAERARYE